jgi:ABC-type transporter Mla maintaining outer membrane lipid asymmetry ATPase subunit MlaF
LKKSKFWKGVGNGFLIGVLVGALVGLVAQGREVDLPSGALAGILGGIGGGSGALIGGIIGATSGKDETIQIEGKSDSEIQETLEKLRKKARVRSIQ